MPFFHIVHLWNFYSSFKPSINIVSLISVIFSWCADITFGISILASPITMYFIFLIVPTVFDLYIYSLYFYSVDYYAVVHGPISLARICSLLEIKDYSLILFIFSYGLP